MFSIAGGFPFLVCVFNVRRLKYLMSSRTVGQFFGHLSGATAFYLSLMATLASLTALSPFTLFNRLLRYFKVPEHLLPSSLFFMVAAKSLLKGCGITVIVEKVGSDFPVGSTIFVYNHTSNLDPFIVEGYCGGSPKFVFKRELLFVPFIGWTLWLYNHVHIDRRNRAKAIESLHNATQKLIDKHQAIAIAPEGTRSLDGKLLPFKKGTFHMAIETGATIVPLVLHGAHNRLPAKTKRFSSGYVGLRILPPIHVTKGDRVDELLATVHKIYEEDLARPMRLPPPHWTQFVVPSTLFVSFCAGVAIGVRRFVGSISKK